MSKGKVLRNEEINPGSKSVKNPHHRDNVNVAQGPRTGNAGAHAAKRGEFKSAKEARAPLADFITRGFAGRGTDDKEVVKPGLEGISADTKVKYKNKK
jgi:hypothetical protein